MVAVQVGMVDGGGWMSGVGGVLLGGEKGGLCEKGIWRKGGVPHQPLRIDSSLKIEGLPFE
jgi:hypothetical protein